MGSRSGVVLGTLALLATLTVGCAPQSSTPVQPAPVQSMVTFSVTVGPSGGRFTPTQIERIQAVLSLRAQASGLTVESFTPQSDGKLALEVGASAQPGASQDVAALFSTGQLDFVEVASLDESVQDKVEDGYHMGSESYTPFMTGANVSDASAAESSDQLRPGYVVNVSFDATGTAIWAAVTAQSAPTNARIAMVLDGVVVSAPAVQSAIPNGYTEISGNFTADEAKRLATILRSGSLPGNLRMLDMRVTTPTK